MSIDALQPTLGVLAVHPKQDAHGQSGRDTRREGEGGSGQSPKEQPDQPQAVVNILGQVTGKTIHVTA